jgi:hypothetical protein
VSRKDKGDKPDKADKAAGKPASGPLGPWRLVLVMLAVAGTSGAVLAQAVQTGVGLDNALARALGVAVVLWILLGSIDRMLAHAHARHVEEAQLALTETDPATTDTLPSHR